MKPQRRSSSTGSSARLTFATTEQRRSVVDLAPQPRYAPLRPRTERGSARRCVPTRGERSMTEIRTHDAQYHGGTREREGRQTPILAAIRLHSPWGARVRLPVPPGAVDHWRRCRAVGAPAAADRRRCPGWPVRRQRLMWTPPVSGAAALVLLAVAIDPARRGYSDLDRCGRGAGRHRSPGPDALRDGDRRSAQVSPRGRETGSRDSDLATDATCRAASDLIGLVTFASSPETACPLSATRRR